MLSQTNQLDLYGRLVYNYLPKVEALVDGSAPVEFSPASSKIARFGARLTKSVTPRLSLQFGLGFEEEFGGLAKATTSGFQVNDVKISGGTGVAELSLSYKNDGPMPISFKLNLDGNAGKRKGVSGNLNFAVSF
jgi:hypothetical protein